MVTSTAPASSWPRPTATWRSRCASSPGWAGPPSGAPRLWPTPPHTPFAGHPHESTAPGIQPAAEADALAIAPSDRLTIQHFGYEGDRPDKRARDEPLLVAEIARNPDRPF